MAKSRRYLNNLPNIEKVKKISRDILDSELKLDKAIQRKERIKKEILKLETDRTSLEKTANLKKLEIARKQLENLSNDILVKDKEINDLKRNIFDLQTIIDEEIREGLSQLYHQAKSNLDEAHKNIIKRQKRVDEAQKSLANASRDDVEKYRHEWISNVEKMINDEEKARKWENQIEAIKRVYKREFG